MKELDPLFEPPADGGTQQLLYRQGTIIAFDLVTGDNVVNVGGTQMQDLPLLGIAEAATLAPGSVVGIVSTGKEYAILGRFARPNTAEYGKALTQLGDSIQTAFDSSTGTITGTSTYIDLSPGTVGPTVAVNVGLSGKLLVTVGCMGEYTNGPDPAPYDQIMGFRMSSAASGANSWGGDGQWSLIFYDQSLDTTTKRLGGMRAVAQHLFTGLNPGLTVITAKYSKPTLGGTATARDRLLVAQAL